MSNHSQQSLDGVSRQIDDAVRRAAELTGEMRAEYREEPAESPPSGRLQIDYSAIDSLGAEVRAAVDRLDQPPPGPPTWRGRLGRVLIGLLRRAFWWQTYPFKSVLDALSRQYSESRWVLERIGVAVEELDLRQGRLEAAQVGNRSLALDFARIEDLRATQTQLESLGRSVSELRSELSGLREQLAAIRGRDEAADAGDSARAESSPVEDDRDRPESRQDSLAEVRDQTQKLEGNLEALGRYEHRTRTQLSLLDRRVATLLKAVRGRLPAPEISAEARPSWGEGDMEYWRFEGAFRGTRDEIKERQQVYIDLFQEESEAPRQPVLDLGCGRGEWLELLGEADVEARGIDANREMIEECRARGLRVDLGDALQKLREVPEGSLGAVTAFHLVEHLPVETLVELIDEAVRALKPGGLCLFETPNPANLLVATQGFYLDPTHNRPLPSPLLSYLMEARGLCDARCMEVNPYPEWMGQQEGDSLEARFNRLVYGPRDYAIIAVRP